MALDGCGEAGVLFDVDVDDTGADSSVESDRRVKAVVKVDAKILNPHP